MDKNKYADPKYTLVSGNVIELHDECPICGEELIANYKLLERNINIFQEWIIIKCNNCHHFYEKTTKSTVFGIETHGYYSDENFLFECRYQEALKKFKNIWEEEKKDHQKTQEFLLRINDKNEIKEQLSYIKKSESGEPVQIKTKDFYTVFICIKNWLHFLFPTMMPEIDFYFVNNLVIHDDECKNLTINAIITVNYSRTLGRQKLSKHYINIGSMNNSIYHINGYKIMRDLKSIVDIIKNKRDSLPFKIVSWLEEKLFL